MANTTNEASRSSGLSRFRKGSTSSLEHQQATLLWRSQMEAMEECRSLIMETQMKYEMRKCCRIISDKLKTFKSETCKLPSTLPRALD